MDTDSWRNKTVRERAEGYGQNAIIMGGFFTPYEIGGKHYDLGAFDPLFDAPYVSEKTKSTYDWSNRWALVGTISLLSSLTMLLWNAGLAMGDNETRPGLWIGGSSAGLIAIISSFMTVRKYTQACKLYNDDLMRALDLQQRMSIIKPQEQFSHFLLSIAHPF